MTAPRRALTPGELEAAGNVATILGSQDRKSYGTEGLHASSKEAIERLHREAMRVRELAGLWAVDLAALRGDGPVELAVALSAVKGTPVTPEQAAAALASRATAAPPTR